VSVQALATISKAGDKYMKKMYLRWKKMEVEQKKSYEDAVASEVGDRIRDI